MGDDSTPRTIVAGSVVRGNTGADLAAANALMVAANPLKVGHGLRPKHPDSRRGPLNQPDGTTKYECKSADCDTMFNSVGARDDHEKRMHAGLAAPPPLLEPAMYTIQSENDGRDSFTCNGNHILVFKLNIRPTQAGAMPSGYRQPYGFLNWEVDCTTKAIHQKTYLFGTLAEAKKAREELNLVWEPILHECTVEEFRTLPVAVQRRAMMYQPTLVNFAPPALSLRARLEAELGRGVTEVEVGMTAWVIGMWLTDGLAAKPLISQIKEDRNNPQHSHTAVVENLVQIRRVLYKESDAEAEAAVRFEKVSSAGNPCYLVHIGAVLWRVIQSYGLKDNKHVPRDLLREEWSRRCDFLSGMIDGDGCFVREDKRYALVAKQREFINGFIHLCRGVGLRTGKVGNTLATNEETGEQYAGFVVSVYGDRLRDVIVPRLAYKRCPTNAELGREPNCDQLCAGFTVTPAAHADYFGFTVDGNQRLLMDDFVVAHNVRSTNTKRESGTVSVSDVVGCIFLLSPDQVHLQADPPGLHQSLAPLGRGCPLLRSGPAQIDGQDRLPQLPRGRPLQGHQILGLQRRARSRRSDVRHRDRRHSHSLHGRLLPEGRSTSHVGRDARAKHRRARSGSDLRYPASPACLGA
jgi:hypothetical protein